MALDANDRTWMTGLFSDTNRRIDDLHKRVTDTQVASAARAAAACPDVRMHEERYDHVGRRASDVASRGFSLIISLIAIIISAWVLIVRL